METGAITGHIDVAQVVLYAFWIFFAGLVFCLLRENKREGYPLVADRTDGRVVVQGFPAMPDKKTFLLHDGTTVVQPRPDNEPPLAAVPVSSAPGSPLTPTGDPMQDGVGPAGSRLVLVPMTLVTVDARRRRVNVASVLARHVPAAPGLRSPEQITLREEDRICTYFGGGSMYATPDRLGPLL
jgi:hypothetical protein